MGRLTVVENLTLDGVMQAPARPDEDMRGGFQHGGWGFLTAETLSLVGLWESGWLIAEKAPPAGALDLRGLLQILAKAEG